MEFQRGKIYGFTHAIILRALLKTQHCLNGYAPIPRLGGIQTHYDPSKVVPSYRWTQYIPELSP
jgi:hypothetical protein